MIKVDQLIRPWWCLCASVVFLSCNERSTVTNQDAIVSNGPRIEHFLPELDELAEIVAKCEFMTKKERVVEIPEFKIPRENWPAILCVLSDSVPVQSDVDMMFCGQLKLVSQVGEVTNVWLLHLDRMYYTVVNQEESYVKFMARSRGQEALELISRIYGETP